MKKIKPHSSSAFSLLVTLALKVLRFVDLLAETKIAFLIRNQTQAPAAECAPLHSGAPLDFRNSESRIRRRPFSFCKRPILYDLRCARPRIKACQQHGKNASQEYAVKSTSATDRSDRRRSPRRAHPRLISAKTQRQSATRWRKLPKQYLMKRGHHDLTSRGKSESKPRL